MICPLAKINGNSLLGGCVLRRGPSLRDPLGMWGRGGIVTGALGDCQPSSKGGIWRHCHRCTKQGLGHMSVREVVTCSHGKGEVRAGSLGLREAAVDSACGLEGGHEILGRKMVM